MIELQYQVEINHNALRKCFYKFLALYDDHCFRCCLCGYYPVILNFDVDRKCCFKVNNLGGERIIKDEVDCEKFWGQIENVVVGQTFEEIPTKKICPSLDFWAPFIPKESRASNFVLNTEYKKGVQDETEQEFIECLSEDVLQELFETASLEKLKELCRQCGLVKNVDKVTRFQAQKLLLTAIEEKVKIDNFFF